MEEEKKYLDYEGLLEYHRNIKEIIVENERVTSFALNDLNDKIIENEKIVSSALNDLNNRIGTGSNLNEVVLTTGNSTTAVMSLNSVSNELERKADKTDLDNYLKNYIDIDSTGGHDYIEIGGVKWATMNIGAESITDTGLYFLWGDTLGYTASQVGSGTSLKNFSWEDYKYGNGTSSPSATDMTKYNASDGKTVLEASDDAVTAAWGSNWRMPTVSEFIALRDAVTTAWTADYQGSGISGIIFTDKTDSSKVLFFPAVGSCHNGIFNDVGSYGLYWTSSIDDFSAQSAYKLLFNDNVANPNSFANRDYGFSVRGIYVGPGPQRISVFGATEAEKTTWNNKSDFSGSYNDLTDKPTILVTGVKGDAETDYRTGNVNLTATNIGLGNVVNLDLSKAIKSITRSGTTFTYTCLDGTTDTFTQQDNNTTYSAGTGLSLSNTTFSLALTKKLVTDALGYTPPTKDTNTTYSAGTGLSLSSTTFSVKYGTAAGTACQGNDSRLSNSRPASDVYSWAKASSKPSYAWSEITSKPCSFHSGTCSRTTSGSNYKFYVSMSAADAAKVYSMEFIPNTSCINYAPSYFVNVSSWPANSWAASAPTSGGVTSCTYRYITA